MIDLSVIRAALPSLDKDERRIRLFVAAVQKKGIEFAFDPVGSNPLRLIAFTKASGELIGKWAVKGKKLSFADLFRDPYKGLREETRAFAAEWDLDPVFRQEMG